jgi:hypothetical protein
VDVKCLAPVKCYCKKTKHAKKMTAAENFTYT